MKVLRLLVGIVLAFFMVCFGLCAGGGAIIMAMEPQARMGQLVGLWAALAVGCFFGMRALLRTDEKEE